MKEKRGGERWSERETEEKGGRVMKGRGRKGEGSYQQVFNDQLREANNLMKFGSTP